jgi:hypothetical protein
MKILGPSDTGKGILVEWDAGIINPNEPRNQSMIKESYGQLEHSKPFEFYATLQKWGVPNRNGRVYPEKILRRESEKYQDAIKRGMSISELNHPESSLIDLDRVSHLITEMWWEGNVLMGKIKLLTTPGFHERGIVSSKGDVAANMMRQGVTMGVSSRGVGSLVKKGDQNEVQDDFELICFDLVSSPSTPGAYLYLNKEDRPKYEEKLSEHDNTIEISNSALGGLDKSVDLMKRLSDYLGK